MLTGMHTMNCYIFLGKPYKSTVRYKVVIYQELGHCRVQDQVAKYKQSTSRASYENMVSFEFL